jgi:hypothetical protein
MQPAISYYWVAIDQQDKSGLGLDAQMEAVRLFAEQDVNLVSESGIVVHKQTDVCVVTKNAPFKKQIHEHFLVSR